VCTFENLAGSPEIYGIVRRLSFMEFIQDEEQFLAFAFYAYYMHFADMPQHGQGCTDVQHGRQLQHDTPANLYQSVLQLDNVWCAIGYGNGFSAHIVPTCRVKIDEVTGSDALIQKLGGIGTNNA
jgi:hypothetical protein